MLEPFVFVVVIVVIVIDGNEKFYKTHNFVVVNQLVDSAELEDNQRSDNLHRCLRLESSIVVLYEARVKQLDHETLRQDT